MHHSQPQPPSPKPTPGAAILLISPPPIPTSTGGPISVPAVGPAVGPALGHRLAQTASRPGAELAHDARNLVSAIDLYCELLAAPGVLAPRFRHYAEDLRRVAATGARLIESLAGGARSGSGAGRDAEGERGPEPGRGGGVESGPQFGPQSGPEYGVGYEGKPGSAARSGSHNRSGSGSGSDSGSDIGSNIGNNIGRSLSKAVAAPAERRRPGRSAGPLPPRHLAPVGHLPAIRDLGAELLALEAPLCLLAGTGVRVEVECAGCAGQLGLNSEALLRILFNLVANTVEAIAASPQSPDRRPFLRITAQRGGGASFLPSGPESGIQPMAEGGPDLLCSDRAWPETVQPETARPETVVLAVSDNGPGIAPGDLPHIFERGFSTRRRPGQTRVPSSPRSPARGLGLAIVRQLAEAAGGRVRASSRPGQGARFEIELPVFPEASPAGGPAVDSAAAKIMLLNSERFFPQIEKEV